ncbi:PD40 domain-containing protein [Gemmatimonas groenlandica]|uniref:TolB protein n=1 Tax=Gemmatimonas groenlandica TaxID=2732249 RepID=A0A6M4IMC3_9BACT|nr:PD40 domain-containing protein [Gemmatimonas groenlandica]QJR34172.1 hypothetical protein HKW67_00905 [Gemmatimonas groenlandica]
MPIRTRPRALSALLPLVITTLISAGCQDDSATGPGPQPLPSFDLVFEETSAVGLNSDRLMVRRLDDAVSVPLFGTQVLGGNPSPSADGARVIFVGSRDGDTDDVQDLFVVGRDAPPQRIPLAAGTESSPTLSPDGTRVAYIKRGADAVGRLYVARVDGSSEAAVPIALAPGLSYAYAYPAWSPDGSTLLFSAGAPGNLHLFSARADGAGLRQLTTGAESDTEGAWSPDGRSVAFVRGTSPARTVLMTKELASGVERAFDFPWRNRSPSWSPDGERIAFASNMADNLDYELYVVRVDGSALQRLTNDELQQRAPRWIRR